MQKDKLTFTADRYGYILFYDGKPLGGASILKDKKLHGRRARANVKTFTEDAQREIAALLAGNGRERFRKAIAEIEAPSLRQS